jgi:predicted O-methyltransferase YrrM
MSEEQWSAVDRYLTDLLVPEDESLRSALRASEEAGLPPIQVSPAQGKFLHVLARALAARRILEIGTLGAYSTIWLARALPPGGRLITLDADPAHARVARANIARAGLDSMVELRLGLALETLPRLAAEKGGPFDLIFIDADKPNTAPYFQWSLKLSRPGTLIITDNVTRKGAVIDAASGDPAVQGMRQFLSVAAAESRVCATALQTVGSKGYDGFALAVVLQPDI